MNISFTKTLLNTMQSIKEHTAFYAVLIVLFLLSNMLLWGTLHLLEAKSFLLYLVYKLLDLALYVKLAVTVHRSVLLGEAGNWKRVFWWNKCETEFYVLSVVLGLFFVFSSMFLGFIINLLIGDWIAGLGPSKEWVWVLLFSLYTWAVLTRICLLFPTLAIDADLSFDDTLKMTGRTYVPLFFLIAIVPIVSLLVLQFYNPEASVIVKLMTGFFGGLILVFEVAIISNIYQQLAGNQSTESVVT